MGLARRLGQVFSLTSAITGAGLWGLVLAGWVSEAVVPRSWRVDDDWIWLLLPLGGIAAIGLWLRFRHYVWMHIVSVLLCAWPIASIVWILNQPVTPGFERLGQSLGKALALVLAQVAAVTGVAAVLIAAAFVAFLSWYEAQIQEPE